MSTKIEDIVNNKLCVGCGLCVSESTSSKMEWNDQGFLVPKLTGDFSDRAIKLCPFNSNPDLEVEDEDRIASIFQGSVKNVDEKIGRYENTFVGYSNEFRRTSSSGGIATYVFYELLKSKIVDYLFIVKEVGGTYEYQWFSSSEEIVDISKTRYLPVTLENLFKEIDQKDGKVAVSGVACFVKAIRLKQYYNPEYRKKIPFIVGIICGGLKSRFFTEFLARKSGIVDSYKKPNYRLKDEDSTAVDYSFGAYDNRDELHTVKMRTLGDMWGTGYFKSNACDFCTDVTTELADISLGDAWIDPYRKEGLGNSVIITRNSIADKIISDGIARGSLMVTPLSVTEIYKSQSGSFNHRQGGVGVRMKILKVLRRVNIFPKVRARFVTQSNLEFSLVQLGRIRVRELSLKYWNESSDLLTFDKKMSLALLLLRIETKIYKKLTRFRGRWKK